MAAKLTQDEAVRRLTERANVRAVSGYPGTANPWPMQCGDCGEAIAPRLNAIMKGVGACRYCAINAPVSHEAALSRLLELANVEEVSEFRGTGKPWAMRCAVCQKSISPRLDQIERGQHWCRHCSRSANLGAYNWKTLSRDPCLRWSSSHLYAREFADDGRTLWKVGIGSTKRANQGRGRVVALVPVPLAVAFVCEQHIHHHGTLAKLVQSLEYGGSTEVVSDFSAVQDGVRMAREHALQCQSLSGRIEFDRQHFPGCVPADELRPSQLSLFAA